MSVSSSCRKTQNAVILRPKQGQHLVYQVSFRGAKAVFTLGDSLGALLLSDEGPQVSPGVWRRKWPRSPAEVPDQNSVTHTLSLSFLSAVAYTYVVERHHADGTVDLIKDCDYASEDPTDTFRVRLRIRGLQS